MRRTRTVVLAAALCALAVPGGARADAAYGPSSYTDGPRGGDSFNLIQTDRPNGKMTLLRVYPIPGAFNCGGSGGYVTFEVSHTVGTAGVREARVAYRDAAADSFAWLTASTVGPAGILATTKLRGPLVGEGTLAVPARDAAGGTVAAGQVLKVRFGLEVASACPNVDGGTTTFPSVTVVE